MISRIYTAVKPAKMLHQKVLTTGRLHLTKFLSTNIRSMSVKSTFLQIDELGEPHKVLKKCETELDSPKENEVLVKILASPINPAVINIIQGISNTFSFFIVSLNESNS